MRDVARTEAFVDSEQTELPSRELGDLLTATALLEAKFKDRLNKTSELSRGLVSFQASKSRPTYRWYKFKEAFSADLVENFLEKYGVRDGKVLDPFAGSGTTLFAASARGLDATGMEVLPIGQKIIETRKCIGADFTPAAVKRMHVWLKTKPWRKFPDRKEIPELRITTGAYSAKTKAAMERYLAAVAKEKQPVRDVLFFALLCVLESISFTRKDGQYLRWDHRSPRRQGAFDKGHIPPFDDAISEKLAQIMADMERPEGEMLSRGGNTGGIKLSKGSCLDALPKIRAAHYDMIVTSPPYCNRYDYTRTYALELALLGVGEKQMIEFRQAMLSCTVENRAKDLLAINPDWSAAIAAADRQDVLQKLLAYLEDRKAAGALNNNGIPRMVRGYFYEMACVIQECARVLKKGARLVMVNDNVRYAGASVPVDLILSDMAAKLGFEVETILVLPKGKGNSSQQMGAHGREPLRKCVYVWRKI